MPDMNLGSGSGSGLEGARADDDDDHHPDGGRHRPDAARDADLIRVLTAIQARGGIGRGPIGESIEHARAFVRALPWPPPDDALIAAGDDRRRIVGIDLGSGGGLPGLVIAVDRPDLELTLVERRAKRADLLAYGARSLGLAERTTIVADDVAHVIERAAGTFDLVTARSFAAPRLVATAAAALLRPGGWLIVSEPPDDEGRWSTEAMRSSGLSDEGRFGRVRRLRSLPH